MQVLCKKLPNDNLWPLVTVLLEGLLDKQPHSSSGACVVLNNIIKLRGPALSDKVCLLKGMGRRGRGLHCIATRATSEQYKVCALQSKHIYKLCDNFESSKWSWNK